MSSNILSNFPRVKYLKLLGEVEGDTESETRFNPYHPETEPNNEFIIPNTIMSLQTKQKHNIDNSV